MTHSPSLRARRIVAASAAPVIIIGCLAPQLLPCGANGQFLTMQLTVLALAAAAYRVAPVRSAAGWLTLMAAWLLLSWGSAANLHQWTLGCGHTVTDPLLMCNDDLNARQMAQESLGIHTDTPYYFAEGQATQYAVVLVALMRLFGQSIIPPLGLSMLASMLSVVLTGVLAARMTSGRPAYRRSAAAMILISAQAYWLTMGTLMMKESLVCLGVTMTLTGLTALWVPPRRAASRIGLWGMIAAGLLLTGLLRLPLAMLTGCAALFMARRGNLRGVAAVVAMCACVWVLMHFNEVVLPHEEYFKVDTMQTDYYDNFNNRQTQQPYMALVGDFALWPTWKCVLWTPVAMAVQWLIPLGWNAGADVHRAVTLAYAHQGWVWYLEGGLALSWLISSAASLVRDRVRTADKGLLRLAAWLIMVWGAVAFMYGGAVSRYLLPMMPVAVCMAVEGLVRWHTDKLLRRTFDVYLVLLAAALCAAAMMG